MKTWSMKFLSLALTAVLAVTLTLAGQDAEAKRLGGGKSIGKQSPNVTQREAAPAGTNSAANSAAKPAAPPAAAPPVAPKRPWGAMLGGLAAGLGLAWLASSLGLGGAFGQIIMFALLALGVMLVVGFVMRKLKSKAEPQVNRAREPFAFEGAGNASPASGYNPQNVGNDSSARPFERAGTAFDANREVSGVLQADRLPVAP
jgi:predicted lipid-binding transport protein (Tim44 family)